MYTHEGWIKEANANLDQLGDVTVHGAAIAPDYVMRTVIAMRERLERHAFHTNPHGVSVCTYCERLWPCPDVLADFSVLGVPQDEE